MGLSDVKAGALASSVNRVLGSEEQEERDSTEGELRESLPRIPCELEMIRLRISIRTLCIVIALAAAECALFAPGIGGIYFGILLNMVSLPTMSLLILVSRRQRRLGRRDGSTPCLTGFQRAGAASLVAVIAALIFVPGVSRTLIGTFDPIRQLSLRMLGFRAETYTIKNIAIHWCAEVLLNLSISSVLTMVILAIASIGGWVGSRRGATSSHNLPAG